MDDHQFDALVRSLQGPVSRKGFVRFLAGLAASRLSSAGFSGSIAAKQRHNNDQKQNKPCKQQGKQAICHCPPGEGGTHCKVECETGGGHDSHPYDCKCSATDPRPLPVCAECPANPKQGDNCQPNLTCSGSCSTITACPHVSGC